jgi:hypothetical protein
MNGPLARPTDGARLVDLRIPQPAQDFSVAHPPVRVPDSPVQPVKTIAGRLSRPCPKWAQRSSHAIIAGTAGERRITGALKAGPDCRVNVVFVSCRCSGVTNLAVNTRSRGQLQWCQSTNCPAEGTRWPPKSWAMQSSVAPWQFKVTNSPLMHISRVAACRTPSQLPKPRAAPRRLLASRATCHTNASRCEGWLEREPAQTPVTLSPDHDPAAGPRGPVKKPHADPVEDRVAD